MQLEAIEYTTCHVSHYSTVVYFVYYKVGDARMIDVWVLYEIWRIEWHWDGRDGFWSGTNMARTMMGQVGLT